MDKSIVIECPIGKIKWLRAPEDCEEIYYYLCKTLNQDLNQVVLYTDRNTAIRDRQTYLDALNLSEEVLQLKAVATGVLKPEPVYTRQGQAEIVKEALATRLTKQALDTVRSGRRGKGKRTESKGPVNKSGSEDPKLAEGLIELRDMGFDDEKLMRLALVKGNYNVETAIELLVTGQVQ